MARRLNLSAWTILVVDDDPPSLSLIKEVFVPHRAVVYTALSGDEALHQLKWIPRPKVVLCDLWMPQMSGYALVEKISTMPHLADIPIIAVTAQAMLGDQERILAAGFDGYISKPFSIDRFVLNILEIVHSTKTRLLRE